MTPVQLGVSVSGVSCRKQEVRQPCPNPGSSVRPGACDDTSLWASVSPSGNQSDSTVVAPRGALGHVSGS